MITSATTVNTAYGQSTVNSTKDRASGASFAEAFANASSKSAKTNITASADKVTISAQAQQVSVQDDIEVEARAYVKTAMDDPMWQKGLIRWGFGGGSGGNDLSESNKQLGDKLSKEFDSMMGSPAANTSRFKEVRGMLMALDASGGKQNFDEASLMRESQVILRAQEMLLQNWNKERNASVTNIFNELYR